MRIHPFIYLILIITSLSVRVASQTSTNIQSQFKFRYITIDEGLTNNNTEVICEDKYGYIWIGTHYGLNKFDGIEVKNYYANEDDSSAIKSDRINTILLDSEKDLWFGTNKGIFKYNEANDNFTNFRHPKLEDNLISVYDIIEDKDNYLWFATGQGVFQYQLKNNKLEHFGRNQNFPDCAANTIFIDGSDNYWISFPDSGLYIFNKKKDLIKRYSANNSKLSNNNIQEIYQDCDGEIWIGTYAGGLNRFNSHDSTFTRFVIDKNNIYSDRVRTIFEDLKSNLFVGTRAGLYIYDKIAQKFTLYANTSHEFSKINANSIKCSYIDHIGGLWLGTHYGGVNYTDMNFKPFITYTSQNNNPHFLNNPTIFGFNEDSKGNLYVCTEKGVNILSKTNSLFHYLTSNNTSKGLSYDDVKSIAIDSKNNLWIGTNNGGLNYINSVSAENKVFKHKVGDSTTIPYNKVYFVFLDSDENVWTLSSPDWDETPSILSRLNKHTGKFDNYYYDFGNFITMTQNGDLLIGGMGGFWLYNKIVDNFTFIENNQTDRKVLVIYEDKKGAIWHGTSNGLFKYNPKTKKTISFTQANKYPLKSVFGIQCDNNDNLWVSTNSGLVKLINAINEPDTVYTRIYNRDDGLTSKEFNYNSSYKNKSGELYFGGNNGFIRFNPDLIVDNTYKANIIISELLINDKLVSPFQEIDNDIVLEKPISQTEKIIFNHKVHFFTLKFHALHFSNPEKNAYKYKLENFDADWKYSGAYNNFITYSNLPAGDYVFIIDATNNDGIFSDNPKSIKIKILPPFWDTWLFRIILVAAFVILIYIILRLRVSQLHEQKRILENAVKKRTSELNNSYISLQEQKYEIQTQNEEIQSQNEELLTQRETIEKNNVQLEIVNQNLRLLNDFGSKLTASLDIPDIQNRIFKLISYMFDIDIYGLGIFDKVANGLVFSNFTERGQIIPEFTSLLNDPTSLASYCFRNDITVYSNNFEKDYIKYISELKIRSSSTPKSVIYIPLEIRGKHIGVLTLQSYSKNSYTKEKVSLIKSLASYIAISLDNSNAYELVKTQKEELKKHHNFLEQLVLERTKDLENAKNKAEESDRLKSAFLSNMSHEIRTPLNAIIGFIDIISDESLPLSERDTCQQIIKNSGFALLQLINDIIDFSKIEAGQIEINKSILNLNRLLLDTFRTFSEELKRLHLTDNKSIELNLVQLDDNELSIDTDAIRFQQIINNLLSNAIKFTHNGKIVFGIKEIEKNSNITFFVRDTGIGIDNKNQKNIFERFYKVDNGNTNIYSGTGLGLAISKHLVQSLGGEIWVNSTVGVGSEFCFSLPYTIKTNIPLSSKDLIVKTKLPDWSERKILIVEDEETNFKVIKSILRKTNVNIEYASNGVEAIELFSEYHNDIDLILMDIKMPKKDGFETIKEIREINKSIPVIAQTAYALANEQYKILDAGFDGYLSKPLNSEKLINTIAGFLTIGN